MSCAYISKSSSGLKSQNAKVMQKAGGIVYKRMISIAYSTYILTAQAHFGHFYTLCTKEWLNSAAKHHKHNDAE